MSTRITTVMMILLVATFAVGCSNPPTERADAARARLEALGPDARRYAPDAFAVAQETLARLEAELERQQQGFAMSRSYDRTEEILDEVDAAAERVESAIEAGKRRAEAEAKAAAEAARQSEINAVQAAAEQAEASTPTLAPGQVALQRSVNVDGKRLSAGTYTLRLADEAPVKNAAIRAGRWVEFVSNGSVSGRALAVVIPEDEISEVASSSYPRNEAWVAELRGGEYVRVWLHRDGMHYLLHLPTS